MIQNKIIKYHRPATPSEVMFTADEDLCQSTSLQQNDHHWRRVSDHWIWRAEKIQSKKLKVLSLNSLWWERWIHWHRYLLKVWQFMDDKFSCLEYTNEVRGIWECVPCGMEIIYLQREVLCWLLFKSIMYLKFQYLIPETVFTKRSTSRPMEFYKMRWMYTHTFSLMLAPLLCVGCVLSNVTFFKNGLGTIH